MEQEYSILNDPNYVEVFEQEPDAKIEPVDSNLALKFVRATDARIAHHKQLGYEMAKAAQVKPGHHYVVKADGFIYNKDMVLMITRREWVEAREKRRQQTDAARNQAQKKQDQDNEIEAEAGHRQSSRGKKVAIP
jgi:hypothetical protein